MVAVACALPGAGGAVRAARRGPTRCRERGRRTRLAGRRYRSSEISGGAGLASWRPSTSRRSRGDALLGVARRLPVVRAAVVRRVITTAARQNGVVGALVFIPGADMPVMTINQVRMVLRIAAAYGEELGAQRALEILSVVGAGFGLARPGPRGTGCGAGRGLGAQGDVGYTATLALGTAAQAYFEAGAPLAPEKAKRISEKIDRSCRDRSAGGSLFRMI